MDLENLSQFNKRLFKKFLGVYVKERRQQLDISVEQLAASMKFTVKDLKLIESGQKQLNQNVFDLLCNYLELDPSELINIGKVTQVQHIMDIYKEIDEHYPR